MMGAGALPGGGGGLSDLAALVEVVKDPKKFEARLAELGSRQDKLARHEAELTARAVELGKERKELEDRHAGQAALAKELSAQEGRLASEAERLRKLEESLAALSADLGKRAKVAEDVRGALDHRFAEVRKAEAAAQRRARKAEDAWSGAEATVLWVRDELAALKAAASEVASRAEAVLAVAPAVEEVLRGG